VWEEVHAAGGTGDFHAQPLRRPFGRPFRPAFSVFIVSALCYNNDMKRLKLYLATSVWNFSYADE
jgi:hypothetical protein